MDKKIIIMKLYYFNPNDYGYEWFVVSDSEENAIKALNKHLIEDFDREPHGWDEPLKWGDEFFQRKVLPNGVVTQKGYTIDVYEPNQVIESEIS